MGRLREVCGCVSGMFIVAGMTEFKSDSPSKEAKDNQYAFVQKLAAEFKEECGSIICRELLALPPKTQDSPVSEARTAEYYHKRPCSQCVRIAAEILERNIKGNNL